MKLMRVQTLAPASHREDPIRSCWPLDLTNSMPSAGIVSIKKNLTFSTNKQAKTEIDGRIKPESAKQEKNCNFIPVIVEEKVNSNK